MQRKTQGQDFLSPSLPVPGVEMLELSSKGLEGVGLCTKLLLSPPQPFAPNPVWIGMESSFSSQAGLTAPVNSTLHSGKGFALLFLPTVLYSSITASALFFLFQDQELEELKQQVSTLKSQNEQLQVTVTQQVSQIQQHKDQYNLLKVQLGMLREE